MNSAVPSFSAFKDTSANDVKDTSANDVKDTSANDVKDTSANDVKDSTSIEAVISNDEEEDVEQIIIKSNAAGDTEEEDILDDVEAEVVVVNTDIHKDAELMPEGNCNLRCGVVYRKRRSNIPRGDTIKKLNYFVKLYNKTLGHTQVAMPRMQLNMDAISDKYQGMLVDLDDAVKTRVSTKGYALTKSHKRTNDLVESEHDYLYNAYSNNFILANKTDYVYDKHIPEIQSVKQRKSFVEDQYRTIKPNYTEANFSKHQVLKLYKDITNKEVDNKSINYLVNLNTNDFKDTSLNEVLADSINNKLEEYNNALDDITQNELQKQYSNMPLIAFPDKHDNVLKPLPYDAKVDSSIVDIFKQLPPEIYKAIMSNVVNIKFINDECKLNTSTGYYVLPLEKYLSADTYKKSDIKEINILCKHEYMYYTGRSSSDIIDECYSNGLCKYCGEELIFGGTVEIKDIDPLAYVMINKFIERIPKCDDTIIKLFFSYTVNNEVKRVTSQFDAGVRYSIIIPCLILYYAFKNDTYSKTSKVAIRFLKLAQQIMLSNGITDSKFNDIIVHYGIDKACQTFTNIVNSQQAAEDNIYMYHPLYYILHDKSAVYDGLDLYLAKHDINPDTLTTGELLSLNGQEYMYKYNMLVDVTAAKLWSNKLLKRLKLDNISNKTSTETITVKNDNTTTLTEDDIRKVYRISYVICPVHSYHEYDKGVCKWCGIKETIKWSTDFDYIKEYAGKYFVKFDMLNAGELIKTNNNRYTSYRLIDSDHFKEHVKTYKGKSFGEYVFNNYKFAFEDKSFKDTLIEFIKNNDKTHVLDTPLKDMLSKSINVAIEDLPKDMQTIYEYIMCLCDTGVCSISDYANLIYNNIINYSINLNTLVS